MSYELEMVQRMYDNDCGQCIEVRASPDFPENVLILTEDDSEEYFGSIHIDLPAPAMRKLAKAIDLLCNHVENKNV